MTVHNRKQYLSAAVDSVINQTFSDFEFIIVDDGSTDGATQLVQEYARRNTRIRAILQENRGLTASLNRGLKDAKAPFIARMDSDDICHHQRLERQIRYMETHPDVVCVGTGVTYISSDGVPMFHRILPESHEAIMNCHLAGQGGFIQHPTAFIRREVLELVGGYDERYQTAQDYALWLKLARHGRLANMEDRLLFYRHHASAVSTQRPREQQRAVHTILNEELDRLGLATPNKLPSRYFIAPSSRSWLFRNSMRSGCWRTAFRCMWGLDLGRWYERMMKNVRSRLA